MSHAPKTWNVRFYEAIPLDSQSQIVYCFYHVSSFACFLLFLLLLLLYRAGLKLAATQQMNRVTTFFLTLNNFVTPVLTFNLLYYTYGASAYVTELPIIGERFLPPSVIRTLIGFSVITLMMGFVGISGMNQEKKVVMEYYMGGMAICTIVIIAMSGLITQYSLNFDDYYPSNWAKLSMYVDRDYFSVGEMGCYTGKFANKGENSSNYQNLKCDNKQMIAYMWDGEFSK